MEYEQNRTGDVIQKQVAELEEAKKKAEDSEEQARKMRQRMGEL